MRAHALTLLPLPALLAACGGPPEEAIAFNNAAEQACYEQVSASLDPNWELRRGSTDEPFVEVLIIDRRIRDIDRSVAFEECIANPAVSDRVSERGPIRLSPADQAIWDGLTDAQKREALIVLQNGGTLADAVSG
ncbi:MAG: hypothetical protein AAFV62_11960 [Pseudomonadota bacterium]